MNDNFEKTGVMLEMDSSKKEEQSKIEAEFQSIYDSIIEKGGVIGSTKNYSNVEMVGLIDGVRKNNRFTEGEIKGLERVTNTGGLRDKIRGLIERERIASKGQ